MVGKSFNFYLPVCGGELCLVQKVMDIRVLQGRFGLINPAGQLLLEMQSLDSLTCKRRLERDERCSKWKYIGINWEFCQRHLFLMLWALPRVVVLKLYQVSESYGKFKIDYWTLPPEFLIWLHLG